MTRRDIIIIAVLVNAGLLAILFMMAINTDDKETSNPIEINSSVTEVKPQENAFVTEISMTDSQPIDEGDKALNEFSAQNNVTAPAQTAPEDVTIFIDQEEETTQESEKNEPSSAPAPAVTEKVKVKEKTEAKSVEVTVKRGDSLDKIARANGTTIQAIKDLNGLKDDRLNIGQVLKVPVDKKTSSSPKQKKELSTKESDKKQVVDAGPQYYTIKSGDNPWKIAKQFQIKVDDLLRLNNMDEDKARNLKIGDKIRVQ